MAPKWNWRSTLGAVLIAFSIYKARLAFSMSSELSAGWWGGFLGEAIGAALALGIGIYLMVRSGAKSSN